MLVVGLELSFCHCTFAAPVGAAGVVFEYRMEFGVCAAANVVAVRMRASVADVPRFMGLPPEG
jgi:hypothetical protein